VWYFQISSKYIWHYRQRDSVLLKQTKFFWAHRLSNQISPTRFPRKSRKTSRQHLDCPSCAVFACARLRIRSTPICDRKYRRPSCDTDPVLILLRNFRSAYFFASVILATQIPPDFSRLTFSSNFWPKLSCKSLYVWPIYSNRTFELIINAFYHY